MIWVLLLIGYLALCLVAYSVIYVGGQAERRAEKMRDEQLIAEIQAMRGDPCPWPIREAAAREALGIGAGGGDTVRFHNQNSSRVLSRGSESPL
jgi:hypothetical protein